MSTMENSAWLFELLSDHDETLSAGAFDKIVAALDEQSEQVRQLAEQRAELLEALRDCREALRRNGCMGELKVVDAAIALAQDRASQAGAPMGVVGRWRLVPVIATPEMDFAGKRALSDNGVDSVEDSDALVCYAAMLAAAPSPDAQQRKEPGA